MKLRQDLASFTITVAFVTGKTLCFNDKPVQHLYDEGDCGTKVFNDALWKTASSLVSMIVEEGETGGTSRSSMKVPLCSTMHFVINGIRMIHLNKKDLGGWL